MVNLLDLPKELLLQIFDDTLPDGIVALAQCSSRSFVLSSDALKKHKAYKERYKIIKIAEEEGPGPLLVEVLQDPRCGQYPRLANFEYCREDLRVPLERDIADVLTQTLVQQPCVPLKELLHWTQEAMSGNQDVTVAILLLLLPDINRLLLPSGRYCESLIRSVVKWSQASIVPQPNLPLARLEKVVIGDNEWNSRRQGRFLVEHGLMIFRGLPSLKCLMCTYRTTRAGLTPTITLQFCDGCTQMKIWDLEISSEDLGLILQHVENLTTFDYIDRHYSSIERYLDGTLQRYAARSLKELKLQCRHNPISELPSHGFHSLAGFTALKKITIPVDTIRHGGWQLSRPSIVEFLPPSVEELTIVGPIRCRNAKELLDQLADAKAWHFPGLRDVHMVKTEYFTMPMIAALEKAGIRMDLDSVDWNLGQAPSSFTNLLDSSTTYSVL